MLQLDERSQQTLADFLQTVDNPEESAILFTAAAQESDTVEEAIEKVKEALNAGATTEV